MQISLTEAVNIISIIKKKIRELSSERERVSTVHYAKGDPRPEQDGQVDQLTKEIEALVSDLLTLTSRVNAANAVTIIDYEVGGRKMISLSEALTLAQVSRAQLDPLKSLADKPEKPVFQNSFRGEGSYELATFDVPRYKKMHGGAEKRVNRLSLAIDQANATTKVEFDNYAFYLGEEE